MSEPATAGHLGWGTLLHEQPPGRPIGGSGALTAALVRRLETDGGRVRLGDGARAIEVQGGGVSAVITAGGERLAATTVVGACHVLTTLELAANGLPPGLVERARRVVPVGDGIGVALRLGVRRLPTYPDAPADVHAGMGLLAGTRRDLAAAFAASLTREAPKRPAALVMATSALDRSVAPPDRHAVTVWGQWYPYDLDGAGEPARRWDARRRRTIDELVAVVEAAAPGFADGIEHALLQTPVDLERELGLLRGNVMHVDMRLPAMFGWRPLPELAGYRTPIEGLYLAGASTHPGGGVSGASGRSCARAVLVDAERTARRRRLLPKARRDRP